MRHNSDCIWVKCKQDLRQSKGAQEYHEIPYDTEVWINSVDVPVCGMIQEKLDAPGCITMSILHVIVTVNGRRSH